MKSFRSLACVLSCTLGLSLCSAAHADQFKFSGNFAADNSVYEVAVDTLVSQSFHFSTTSFSKGGFVPTLTLFDGTGSVLANDGSGTSDASIEQLLGPGSYQLFLTELPNVATGNLSDGFLFAGDPTATGTVCNVTGGMFLNSTVAPCTQLGSNFDLTVDTDTTASVTPVAATPEPSSVLLMLAPASGLLWMRRRQNV